MPRTLPERVGDLAELIAKLEAAEAPGRSFDIEIWSAILTDAQEHHCTSWCRMDGRTDLTRADFLKAWAPEFTKSLDAALTLVEGRRMWLVERIAQLYWASVAPDEKTQANTIKPKDGSYAPTPALALCIAALRARSA